MVKQTRKRAPKRKAGDDKDPTIKKVTIVKRGSRKVQVDVYDPQLKQPYHLQEPHLS